MRWYAQWLVMMAAGVLMPAAAFCFSGYTGGKTQEKVQPTQKSETVTSQAIAKEAHGVKEKAPTHVGKVVESINAKDYTYILLEKKNGDKHWFAVPLANVTVGQEVELMQGMEMGQFTSKIINRTFESINFSGGIIVREDDETIKKKAHAEIVIDTKGGEAGLPVKVEKATGPNAFSVEEIYQKKGELSGKSIVVRGKVVKVSAGIMGKNWVHLRDGSGDAAKGTHNLILTSQDVPVVGDIVTVTGDFFLDKDFGSGYKYNVIVENATIKK